MKKNKILLFIFCFGIVSNVLSICTYATNGILKDSEILHSEGIYIITEKDDLNHYIIEADNEKMPEGYYLEKIIIDSTFNDITEKENILDDGYNINEKIGEVVNNVKKVATSVYFPDEPLSNDWYDGPTISHKYIFSEEVSPKITAKLGASNNALEVALGFDITKSVKKTKEAVLEGVSSNQRLNVKVYGLYDKYSFEVYSMGGNFKGCEYAYKPMGLYIYQKTYNKF